MGNKIAILKKSYH